MSPAPASTLFNMRPQSADFGKLLEESKPSKSDVNWVIMDYLVSAGYPGAAERFAQETSISEIENMDTVRQRVKIRDYIYAGKIDEAIESINAADPEILDKDHLLHFHLLQLQLIEIIRAILAKGNPQSADFRPALEFATEQLSPRAPTDPKYQQALERTMALMIFPPEKMAPEFKELLDLGLREKVANSVNRAILRSTGQRCETKIGQLVRANAWSIGEARQAKVDLPNSVSIGLDVEGAGVEQTSEDAMVS